MKITVRSQIGSDIGEENLRSALSAYARIQQGALRAGPAEKTWTLKLGQWGAFHPNHLRITGTLQFTPDQIEIVLTSCAFPWEARKVKRILDFRLTQIVDFIQTAHRGGSIEPFRVESWVHPFCLVKRPVTARDWLVSFTWIVLSMIAGVIGGLVSTGVMGWVLISDVVAELHARADVLHAHGELPLPSLAELESFGFSNHLGAAFLLGIPIAMVLSIAIVLAMAWHELSARQTGLTHPVTIWGTAAAVILYAFLPLTLTALGFALVIPLAVMAGYRCVWARKGEQRHPVGGKASASSWLRGGAAPVFAGGLLLMAILTGWGGMSSDDFARVRDKVFLSTPEGKSFVDFYYHHAFYPAEMIKPWFASDGRNERQQKTALVRTRQPEPILETMLKRHGVTVILMSGESDLLNFYDLIVCENEGDLSYQKLKSRMPGNRCLVLSDKPGQGPRDAIVIDRPLTSEHVEQALMQLNERSHRGQYAGWLAGRGFLLIAVLMPIVVVGGVVYFLAWMVVLIHRRLRKRTAWIVTSAAVFLSAVILVTNGSAHDAVSEATEEIRSAAKEAPPRWEVLYRTAHHELPGVRYEAVYAMAHLLKPGSDPRAEEELISLLGDQDVRVRLWAVRGLGELRSKRAVPVLIRTLKDEDMLVKARAAEALGMIGDAAALSELKSSMQRDPWYVGSYCLDAIRKLEEVR